MGKRQRQKRRQSNVAKHSQKDDDTKSSKPLEMDVDKECVEYDSDEVTATDKPKRHKGITKGDDSEDMGEDSGAELQLNSQVADESDVEVDIEFFDPSDADISTVAAFLNGFAAECGASSGIDCRGISELVCRQTRVGTVVRVGNEPVPIGFISCLNVREYRRLLDPLKRFLVAKSGVGGKFGAIVIRCFEDDARFESQRMGLVLCERVVNIPPLVVPKMYEALVCELTWALEDEPTQELRDSYRFGWYLYIMEVFIGRGEDIELEDVRENVEEGAGKAVKEAESKNEQLMSKRIEDSVWLEHAAHKIEWNVLDSEQPKDGYRRKRIAALVPASKLKKIQEKLIPFIGGVAEEVNADVELDRNEGDL